MLFFAGSGVKNAAPRVEEPMALRSAAICGSRSPQARSRPSSCALRGPLIPTEGS